MCTRCSLPRRVRIERVLSVPLPKIPIQLLSTDEEAGSELDGDYSDKISAVDRKIQRLEKEKNTPEAEKMDTEIIVEELHE